MNLFNFFSCTEERNIYVYNTNTFKEKEKELKISLEEATKIYANYIFKQDTQKTRVKCILDVIYNDNYIFIDSPLNFNSKTGYNISGIWVNGHTGEIKEKKSSKYVKIPNELNNINVIIPFQKEIIKKR